MYAIVEVAGMQFKAEESKILRVPKMDVEPGKSITLDKILLVADKDSVQIGKPIVANAEIKATVIDHGKDKKILVFKKKRRKTYQVLNGHRQQITELKIEKISLGKAAPKAAEAKEDAKAEPAAKAAPKKAAAKPTGEKAAAKPAVKKAPAKKAPAKKAPAKKAETQSES